MEKTLLRSVIVGLNPGQEIDVVFRGALADRDSGTFRVVNTKRGRGKGGSWLADLIQLDETGGSELPADIGAVSIGTPRNDDILNVTVDGAFFGYTHESEVPANYETNGDQAIQLKETFKGLMNAAETRPMVEIEAPGAPEVNGNFTVVDARQLRGRAGQIVLTLLTQDGSTVELWSYRHSGVVTSFTVVGP